MRVRCWRAVVTVLLPLTLHASSARAQNPDDKAAADVLFEQGTSLMKAGKHAEACPKLAESLRLDIGIGTMLYLADCYEKIGKTASAWAQFREAVQLAARDHDAREKVAQDRADKLEPVLSRLSVVVTAEPLPAGLTVTRDGTVIGRPLWGIEVPVDPGTHAIRASAPGYEPWDGTVTVGERRAHATITVPALVATVRVASDRAPVAPPASNGEAGKGQRTVGIGLAALGVVGLGVGAFFGVRAIGKLSDADARCNGSTCDQEGLDLRDSSRSQANVSTVAFIVGGVALAAGAVVWFTAPKRSVALGVSPAFANGFGGLTALGRF